MSTLSTNNHYFTMASCSDTHLIMPMVKCTQCISLCGVLPHWKHAHGSEQTVFLKTKWTFNTFYNGKGLGKDINMEDWKYCRNVICLLSGFVVAVTCPMYEKRCIYSNEHSGACTRHVNSRCWQSLLINVLQSSVIILCECTHIQGNCKILNMIDYVVARNYKSIAQK